MFIAFCVLFTSLVWAQVNINTADAEALASLEGIGKAKAEAIVEYRKTNGPFKSLEELVEVKGIGDKMLEKIKGEISID
jgi:competence protein ComEA